MLVRKSVTSIVFHCGTPSVVSRLFVIIPFRSFFLFYFESYLVEYNFRLLMEEMAIQCVLTFNKIINFLSFTRWNVPVQGTFILMDFQIVYSLCVFTFLCFLFFFFCFFTIWVWYVFFLQLDCNDTMWNHKWMT